MPGVRELLDALAPRDDVYLALLTGNYETGARLKLEYFDLWRYFPCGAFGDEAPRSERPRAQGAGAPWQPAAGRRSPRPTPSSSATRRSTSRAPRTSERAIARRRDRQSFSRGVAGRGADVVLKDLSDTGARASRASGSAEKARSRVSGWRKRLGVEPSLPA